jgi:S-adenosylmethionine-diacylgycerolhomoserine-N-methlytransferase
MVLDRLKGYLNGALSELRVLYALAFHRVTGETHQARLKSFYTAQADDYDAFRKRLLHGREELVADVALRSDGGIWVDMGGGTGANLEMMGDAAIKSFTRVYVVDLCTPLLEVARRRCQERGWHNVQIVEADAATWQPDEGMGSVSVLTFSYSLSMIPDWFCALDHARALLAPGGLLGVVDFYVARKHPDAGMASHSWLQRAFWPVWFANDDVRLSDDHVPYLLAHFERLGLHEEHAPVPYIGLLMPHVPYYRFVGTISDPRL